MPRRIAQGGNLVFPTMFLIRLLCQQVEVELGRGYFLCGHFSYKEIDQL